MKPKQELSLASDGYHIAVSYAVNLQRPVPREDPRTKDSDLSLRICINPNKDNL